MSEKNLEIKLQAMSEEIRAVIDEVAYVRKETPEKKQETAKILEDCLSQLYRYYKNKCQEKEDNLLEGVSFFKIKLMNM